MNFLLKLFEGKKTNLAAVGLIGLALYQLSQKQYEAAMQSFFASLAAFGLRSAISKATEPLPEDVS